VGRDDKSDEGMITVCEIEFEGIDVGIIALGSEEGITGIAVG
jgi:hypothetical protein